MFNISSALLSHICRVLQASVFSAATPRGKLLFPILLNAAAPPPVSAPLQRDRVCVSSGVVTARHSHALWTGCRHWNTETARRKRLQLLGCDKHTRARNESHGGRQEDRRSPDETARRRQVLTAASPLTRVAPPPPPPPHRTFCRD